MVELRKDVEFTGPVITGFTPHGYKIGDQRFEQGLLISPEQAVGWAASGLDSLDLAGILSRLNLSPPPEFLLLGSGASMQQPPAAFRREVEAAGMGLEGHFLGVALGITAYGLVTAIGVRPGVWR